MPAPRKSEHLDVRGAERRHAPSASLPISGFEGEAPESPIPLSEDAERLYAFAWRSPVAAWWLEADALLVADWASLQAIVNASYAAGEPKAALLAQVKARSDALGMSPKARQMAALRVVAAPPATPTGAAPSRFDTWNPKDFDDGVETW